MYLNAINVTPIFFLKRVVYYKFNWRLKETYWNVKKFLEEKYLTENSIA